MLIIRKQPNFLNSVELLLLLYTPGIDLRSIILGFVSINGYRRCRIRELNLRPIMRHKYIFYISTNFDRQSLRTTYIYGWLQTDQDQ